MKHFTIILIGTCALALCGWGQETQNQLPESYIALLRSNIQTRKIDIIQQHITFADDQAKKFWPLQRAYENDLSKLGDQRLDVIREFAKNWDNLTDESAKDLGKRFFDYQKKRLDLGRRYFDRISREISPTVAARFFQIETQMEEIIDLDIASSLPLIKVAREKR